MEGAKVQLPRSPARGVTQILTNKVPELFVGRVIVRCRCKIIFNSVTVASILSCSLLS